MVSALALLQRWSHSLSPGTANPNVHAVTAWKISSLQHTLVASRCESHCSKPMPYNLIWGLPVPKGKGERRSGRGGPKPLQHSPLGNVISRSDAARSFYRQRAVREEILRSLREQLPGSGGKLPSGGWLVYVLGEGKLRMHICVSKNAVILHSVSKRLSPAKSEAGKKKSKLAPGNIFPLRCLTLALWLHFRPESAQWVQSRTSRG